MYHVIIVFILVFFLNPSLYSFPYQNTGDDDYNMDDDYEDDDDYEGYDDGWWTKGKFMKDDVCRN